MNTLLIVIVIIVIIALIIYFYISSTKDINSKYKYVKGKCGLDYYVMDDSKSQYAADMLCDVNDMCLRFIDYLKNKYIANGSDAKKKEMIRKLIDEYDVTDLRENGSESFTIGKGVKIHICLRDDKGEFIDINTIMFVVIHELSHIITLPQTNPHTPAFWLNNIWMMEEASKLGILQLVNYTANPEKYCGTIIINKNPMFDDNFKQYVFNNKDADKNIES